MATKKANKKEKFILDTITDDQLDFYLRSLRNKTRNLNKKLKEISQLQDKSQTEELKAEQLEKVSKQDQIQEAKRDLNRIALLYIEAKTEEKNNPTSGVKPKQASSDLLGKEETKEEKKDNGRSAAQSIVQLLFVGNYLRTESSSNLKQDVADEIVALTLQLTSASGKQDQVEKKLQKFLSGGSLSQSVEVVAKSESFKKWSTSGNSHSNAEKSQATTKPSVVASTSNTHSSPSKGSSSKHVSAPVVTQVQQPAKEAVNSESTEAKKEVLQVAPSAVIAHTASTGAVVVVAGTSEPVATEQIEDDDDDDSRFQSENEDNKEEVQVIEVPKQVKEVIQQEEDEWIISGKKKEDTHHHRPQGVWKERQNGGMERPFNQRRGPRQDRVAEGGEPRPEQSQEGSNEFKEKIREDRNRRGEQGEFGKRSNQRRNKESGNVRVPEYIPKDQLKKSN